MHSSLEHSEKIKFIIESCKKEELYSFLQTEYGLKLNDMNLEISIQDIQNKNTVKTETFYIDENSKIIIHTNKI